MTPILLALALVGPADAPVSDQDADQAALVGTDGDVRVYDFEDDTVEGEVLSPEGANIASRARIKHASLIEIRPHFIRELVQLSMDL